MTKCVTDVTGGDYLFGGVALGVRLFVLIRVCTFKKIKFGIRNAAKLSEA